MVLIGVQPSVAGSYRPPVLTTVGAIAFRPTRHHFAPVQTRVIASRLRRVGGAGCCPAIRRASYRPPLLKELLRSSYRPRQSFHSRSRRRCEVSSRVRRVGRAGWCPAIRSGVIPPTGVKGQRDSDWHSAPHNHPAAGPDGGVDVSRVGRVGCAGCCPAVCTGSSRPPLLTAPSDQETAPDNHFAAGPHGGVVESRVRRIGRACCRPGICRRIVLSAAVEDRRRSPFRPKQSFCCPSRRPCEDLAHRARWSCLLLSSYR